VVIYPLLLIVETTPCPLLAPKHCGIGVGAGGGTR